MNTSRRTGVSSVICTMSFSVISIFANEAQAACNLVAGAGDDAYVCDSGSSAGLTDLVGNNSLTFPSGGSGTITGNVLFGPGADPFTMDSGSLQGGLNQGNGANTFAISAGAITGAILQGTGNDSFTMTGGKVLSVNQGDGANTFAISGGTITGAVQQGSGIDNFQMTGGSIGSLAQGDGRDVFFMSAGTIVGAFEDGDVATMTGGTIGRVDMKLDNNIYNMSGGRIIGNLVTGFGRDTIIVSGGSIGGNISVSGGDDSVTVTGGVISGEVRMSFGNDTFNWSNGGEIHSAVLMGDGDDTARLTNLTESTLSLMPSLDAGDGNDQLTFDHTTSAGASRYLGWETVNLSNASRFDLSGNFFLGDSISQTGTFNIDGTSTLAVTQGAIRSYTAGQLATLNNAGTIDMTTGSSAAGDTLSVFGNYVGNNGQLRLQTVLGDDTSATDKLVVSQGTISGTTRMAVTNLGGAGGETRNDGIEVVQALNGATSSTSAFTLSSSVSAGAFQYYLFKGGVTGGNENNWYLRSSVAAVPVPASPPAAVVPVAPAATVPIPATPPTVAPDEPAVEAPTATPVAPVTPTTPATTAVAAVSPQAAVGTPALPTAVPGADPIPLYRLEVPVYSVIVPAAQMMTLSALGTFHDRQGEQSLLTETGGAPAGWGRVYGSEVRKSWSGTVSPSFDGSMQGYQIGNDLYASTTDNGQLQRFGLFVGQSHLRGDVDGFAEGFQHRNSGHIKLDGDHVGAYWTLVDPKGWYVDAVAMGSRLDGTNRSDRGVKLDTDGHALTLSLESGYPFPVSEHWVLEPQVQVINQKINLDRQNDGISDVSFDSQDYWTGRLGVRMKGRYLLNNLPVEPYLRANAWHTFGGQDTVTYDGVDRIKSDHQSSTADLGVGVVARVSSNVSLYLALDYNTNLDSEQLEGSSGNLGVRVSW